MTFKEARTVIQKRYGINIADAGMVAKDTLDNSDRLGFGKIRTEERLNEVLDDLERE